MKYEIKYKGKLLDIVELKNDSNLTKREFFLIRREITKVDDFEVFGKKWNLSLAAVKSIYGNEIVHMVKKRYHWLKRESHIFLKKWKDGESIVDIARRCHFPAVLIARFILAEMGYSKSEITECIRNPQNIHFRANMNNERLIREILETRNVDFVYSPAADNKSKKVGKDGETKLENWLKEKNISFRTEKDLSEDEEHKNTIKKTPDILLDEPIYVNEMEVWWLESKSIFGTPKEMKRHRKIQFKPYIRLFGKGIVVYWHGYTMDVLHDKDFIVVNSTFFQ